MEIESRGSENGQWIIVYIDKLLHLRMPRYSAIYSWWDDARVTAEVTENGIQEKIITRWFIEFAHDNKNVIIEYTTEEKWQRILKELEKHL